MEEEVELTDIEAFKTVGGRSWIIGRGSWVAGSRSCSCIENIILKTISIHKTYLAALGTPKGGYFGWFVRVIGRLKGDKVVN